MWVCQFLPDFLLAFVPIESSGIIGTGVFTARRNARIASAVLAIAIPSVCPSVRHTLVLFQNDGT